MNNTISIENELVELNARVEYNYGKTFILNKLITDMTAELNTIQSHIDTDHKQTLKLQYVLSNSHN